jgi:hypothetical protein
MDRLAFGTIASLALCTIPHSASAWKSDMLTGKACRAALGTPESAITSRENPDPVRLCKRIPQTPQEVTIREKEIELAKQNYEKNKPKGPGTNSAR